MSKTVLPIRVLGPTEVIPPEVHEAYANDAAYQAVYRGVTPEQADFIRSGFTKGVWPTKTWDGEDAE